MIQLSIGAPPSLEAALGVEGDARYFGMYWTPAGDEAIVETGASSYDGYWPAYQIFVAHAYVQPHLRGLRLGASDDEARHMLIVDRASRDVFVAELREGRKFLRAQHPPMPEVDVAHLQSWLAQLAQRPPLSTSEVERAMRERDQACVKLKTELDEKARHRLRLN
jgi:hypothetical protein